MFGEPYISVLLSRVYLPCSINAVIVTLFATSTKPFTCKKKAVLFGDVITELTMRTIILSFLLAGTLTGCSGSNNNSVPKDALRADTEIRLDSTTVDLQSHDIQADIIPETVPDDGNALSDAKELPTCPAVPEEGLELAYNGPTEDPTEYPESTAFYTTVDQALAGAASGEPAIELNREVYPTYDFKMEDASRGRLGWEFRVRNDHFGVLDYMTVFASTLQSNPDDTASLLSFLSDKLDHFVDPESITPFLERAAELAAEDGALLCALEHLYALDDQKLEESVVPLDQIPASLKPRLAEFVYTLYFVRLLQNDAYKDAAAAIPMDEALYDKATSRTFNSYADPAGLEAFAGLMDFRQLFRSSQVLAAGMDRLADSPADWDVPQKITFTTPAGVIEIGGTGTDYHKGNDGPHLLILDAGGDDFYFGTVAASRPGVPISIIIDLNGADSYESTVTEPTQAAGYLGIGMLWDRGDGNDSYIGRYNSIASACLGIAVLNDGGGDDLYDSIINSQASATAGAAILADAGGDDHYYAFRSSQSYASYRGTALLLDVAGDDLFEAEDDEVIYPAAQNQNYNANMCQAAGQGLRNDAVPIDEMYAGGIAILADLAGDDIYTAGIFAQGVGYWFGAGFLLDLAGNDSYSGVWYNFGAAAHFAGGAHYDGGGNDDYYCFQDQCMGEGRDYSFGFMVNQGGDDAYYAKGGRNIGSGDLFGSGIFWDDEGTDSYKDDQAGGIGFVYAEKYVENSFTFGLFLDSGTTEDTYDIPADHPENNKLWTQIGNNNDGEYTNVKAIGQDQ
jgi:hypothetical protein